MLVKTGISRARGICSISTVVCTDARRRGGSLLLIDRWAAGSPPLQSQRLDKGLGELERGQQVVEGRFAGEERPDARERLWGSTGRRRRSV